MLKKLREGGGVKKKQGATIRNWQIHNLNYAKGAIEKIYPGTKAKPMVFTGTVVKDPTGKWQTGDHMRSSLIVSINKARTRIETINTVYTVMNEGGDVVGDLGNNVLKLFY